MTDLASYTGRRIEIEHEGRRIRGQVVRGPRRDPILLEDLGEVGDSKSDAHERLRMVRTWTERQLDGAEVIQVISSKRPTRKKKRKKKPWSETVAIAEGDPALPPPNWEGGLLAWAETVHAARRKVDRSRKAMLAALKEAAG